MADQFEWRVSEDRKTASLVAPTDPPIVMSFTADLLDGLLKSAMEVRAALSPPHAADFAPGQTVQAIENPRVVSELDTRTGRSLLHIRHPGYGWLHFLLPKDHAAKLAELLRKQVERPPQPSSNGRG
jgi:hypothetical protein